MTLCENIARRAHTGQVDKIGSDYIGHVERVVNGVEGDDAKAVAWLHDVLEDTGLTREILMDAGVPRKIVAAVEILTRVPPYDYEPYIDRILRSRNPLAIAVKMADLKDHLRADCPRSLRPRYERALDLLMASELGKRVIPEPTFINTAKS